MTDLTPLQIAQDAVRGFRNEKLSNTDWTVLTDSPLNSAAKTEYTDYRQYLRDLPENMTDDAVLSFQESDIQDFDTWLADQPET
jgi:hypothetical protein